MFVKGSCVSTAAIKSMVAISIFGDDWRKSGEIMEMHGRADMNPCKALEYLLYMYKLVDSLSMTGSTAALKTLRTEI